MKCPYCGSTYTERIDSRDTTDNRIRRRRVCHSCNQRFTTYEVYIKGMTPLEKQKAYMPGKGGRKKHDNT